MIDLKKIKKQKNLFFQFHCGLERETLRISPQGKLSRHSHPLSLGSPLTNPYFGVDFGEAQLEWNTPPLSSFQRAEAFLEDLMAYSSIVNPKELFWPYSMPCPLPKKIQLARFGSSHEGRQKELYRRGLKYRYGTNLQMISSIHFNFSFSSMVWDFLYDTVKSKKNKKEFINHHYFKMIRNFLSEGWILTYLFGASPAMDQSYATKRPKGFKKVGTTLYHPDATSIRMSYLGYYSRIQSQLAISFNDLDTYIKEMKFAISTPCPLYQKIGTKKGKVPIQINDYFLQIENEHYGRIRPKRRVQKGETLLNALKKDGVEYVEIRSIDLDPFKPLGIDHEQLLFLHQFLLYCLFKNPSKLSEETYYDLTENQHKVALQGRKKNLMLKRPKPMSMEDWGREILEKIRPIAHLLDGNHPRGYLKNLLIQGEKINDPHLTPSSRILKELKGESLRMFGLKWAKIHQKNFKLVSDQKKQYFQRTVKASLEAQKALETASEVLAQGYENLELSTQILIKEALNQEIDVEVLDPKDSILRLKKGKHIQYVKQATKTSLDPYVVPHLMENKQVTKILLKENGFSTPDSKLYCSMTNAQNDYFLYQQKKIVIKPKSTNFGIGISFVLPNEKKEYLKALEEAFLHDDSVLIETFCHGKEYRFLIIGTQVVGIVHRIPAHIIGDGIHTIKELVHQKNHDPTFYRPIETHLRLQSEEKQSLQKQNLTIHSIPKKGKKIFLRKNSNVSTGGDAIDVTDQIHKSYLDIATNAASAIGATICGVDMMISHRKKPADKKNHAIIELNYNPVLFFHAFPNKGKKRNVAKPLLKLLGF